MVSTVNPVETDLAERSGRGRIFELDALRGIAACVVMLSHYRHMFEMESPRLFLRPFFAGRAAVVLFFSLSGFVLSLSFWHGRTISYPRFILRRLFRIYLPYVAACLIAVVVGKHFLFSRLPLTPWFYETWHSELNSNVILKQIFTMSTDAKINTAFWSIRYEMELSLVFPLLCALLSKIGSPASVLLGLACEVFGLWLSHAVSAPMAELGTTIKWSSCFIFGAVLAKRRVEILDWYSKLHPIFHTGILLFGIVGLFSVRDVTMIPCSCAVIVAVQSGLTRRILRSPVPEYLGRISYSLYLLHGTVLFAFFILFYGKISSSLICVVYLLTAFGVSHLFNRYAEEPLDRLGKLITRKPRRHATTPQVARLPQELEQP
jgi:peptidoglycan/LPS O-acetylase OafA/YrhL